MILSKEQEPRLTNIRPPVIQPFSGLLHVHVVRFLSFIIIRNKLNESKLMTDKYECFTCQQFLIFVTLIPWRPCREYTNASMVSVNVYKPYWSSDSRGHRRNLSEARREAEANLHKRTKLSSNPWNSTWNPRSKPERKGGEKRVHQLTWKRTAQNYGSLPNNSMMKG